MMRKRRSTTGGKFTKTLRELLPKVTLADFQDIQAIAAKGHLRHLPDSIVAWQATTTHIRHNYTDYDALLEEGYDAESARHFVLGAINDKLEEWGSLRQIEENETDT
ncbi:MAG: DUF2293 domain-containing protein [Salaquimonas sp.]